MMNKNETAKIVGRAKAGEREAFEQLYKAYHDKLYFFVLKNVGDKHTAEDITEEAFLASMQKISTLKNDENYETWLHSIAFNKCRMYFREESKNDSVSLDDTAEADLHADDTVMLPDDYADSRELKRSLKEVIDGMKADMRSAVILYYYDGMPMKKVADVLGISENAAKQKLFKARGKIKKEIERIFEGGVLSAVPVSVMLRNTISPKFAASAVTPAAKPSSIAVKTAGIAAALAVAVSIPIALNAISRDGFGIHENSSIADSFDEESYSDSSSLTDSDSEKEQDYSATSRAETSTAEVVTSAAETLPAVTTTTTSVQTTTALQDTQTQPASKVMPGQDFTGEQFFSKTVGEMLDLAGESYELVYPTFVQQGYNSMYQCGAFAQYHFGRAAYDTEKGTGYVDKSQPVTRVELYSGAYLTKDIYVGMTYNELCNALGEKPLMYLSNTDRDRIVSANINGRVWWFGFDLTDEQLDETYKRMQAQTDSETFGLNPYQYGIDVSDIDPVTNVAVCDISYNEGE